MTGLNAALLINLLGFAVGIALYVMLAAMVLRHPNAEGRLDGRLLATSFLGFLWNFGELVILVRHDLGAVAEMPLLTAAAYSALGFLPSVVIHSAETSETKKYYISYCAYAFSFFAAGLHFYDAFTGLTVPSEIGLLTLTAGSAALGSILLFLNFRQPLEKKALLAAALLVFGLSSLHLAGGGEGVSWVMELVAHQASLTIAIVILLQNFRFAFADLFLKRAISLLLITGVASILYLLVASPLLQYHESHDRNDVFAVSLLLVLWVATALAYPAVHRLAVWLVDRIILRRPDYVAFERKLANTADAMDSITDILDEVRSILAKELTAGRSLWEEGDQFTAKDDDDVRMEIRTTEEPHYMIEFSELGGGRRLLSDEIQMLDSIAVSTARRIDALRVVHERCDRELREQEFSKLATEAQLTALRAQMNPHFLFNALTTIGYLIQTAPEKAFETLMQLTKLLRGVLNTNAEFTTVEDEMRLIESYLSIERTRFEERLKVEIDVPPAASRVRIPSLVIQPLIENAIKHAISENRNGGQISVKAAMANGGNGNTLHFTVADSGSGKPAADTTGDGVGLSNIRERLRNYYGDAARLSIDNRSDGTKAELVIPIDRKNYE